MMKNALMGASLLLNLALIGIAFYALQKYGGWKNLWAKVNNRGIENTYFHRKNLFDMLPERDSGIVFLGNSITAQGEWAELFDRKDIFNRGIPGDHCDGVRERLDAIQKLYPTKLFLLIGINDLAYHPPLTVASKYERLLEELTQAFPHTAIFVQSVFPVNNMVSPTPIDNEDVRLLNRHIQQLAEKYRLVFLDTHPLLSDADGNLDAKFTSDGIHLNGAAYIKWRDFLQPFFR